MTPAGRKHLQQRIAALESVRRKHDAAAGEAAAGRISAALRAARPSDEPRRDFFLRVAGGAPDPDYLRLKAETPEADQEAVRRWSGADDAVRSTASAAHWIAAFLEDHC